MKISSSFLKKGLLILTNSNYNVISAWKEISMNDLVSNIGFWVSVGYWGGFIILAIIL